MKIEKEASVTKKRHDFDRFLNTVEICERDLPESAIRLAKKRKLVAWDIETTGLEWSCAHISTCQVFIPDECVFVIRVGSSLPNVIKAVLEDETILKVFHHAIFDMRFMVHHWSAKINNVACTKVASKILSPRNTKHSLKDLLWTYLKVSISKQSQTSDWNARVLSDEQINYAANDVIYLPTLFTQLGNELKGKRRWILAQESFAFLPTRVQLDLLGSNDVFQY